MGLSLMGIFLVRAVLNAIITSPNIEYSVSVSASSCDEGETSPQITISRDLNGLPHQDSSIRFRTLSAVEFAAEFPGDTQALAADFAGGYSDDLAAACAAAGIGFQHIGGQYDKLIWTAGSQASVSFTRVANANSAAQGDKRSAYIIEVPSVGTVVDDIASFEIIDTTIAPPVLTLVDPGLVYTPYRSAIFPTLPAVPGEVVCWIEAATGAIQSGGVSLTNDANGKFAVGPPVGGRYPIVTTSSPADFEGIPWANGQTVGVSHEVVTARVLGTAAETIDQTINIWPEFPQIVVTGDGTGNNTNLSTASAIDIQLNSSVSNRTLSVVSGIFKIPASGVNYDDRSNATWRGVRGSVLRVGRGPETRFGTNKLYKNLSFRAGGHYVNENGGSPGNVDNIVCGLNNVGQRLKGIKFENCSFSLTWDELISVIQAQGAGNLYPRGVWFDRCFFHSPLYDPRDGVSNHAYGPIIAYEHVMWVVMNRCVIAGCSQRSPFIGKTRGVLLQNNVIVSNAGNVSGQSAITIKADNSVSANQDLAVVIRGNLIQPQTNSGASLADAKSIAIGAIALGPGSYINANFGNPPYENHFTEFQVGEPNFASDPLVLATHVKKQAGTQDAGLTSFVNFDPFIGPDYGYMPTDTEANRRAMWLDVMAFAGNRMRSGDPYNGALVSGDSALDRWDYNAMESLRQTGRPRATTTTSLPTIAIVDAAFGTAWDGVGGSVGYAMNAVPP